MKKQEFTARYNELTVRFLQLFANKNAGGNIVFSPFSILSLLSVLADATSGNTRQEVLNVLYSDKQQKGFPEQLKSVREELTSRDDSSWMYGYEDGLIRDWSRHLNTSNAVCVREEYRVSIQPGFRKLLSDLYQGYLFCSSDLAGLMNARDTEMCSLEDMKPLLEEILCSDCILSLINTVSFDAMWQWPYEGRSVRKGIFHNADHTDSTVTMLHNGADSYVENELATGFVKIFQQCGYSFMALLPRKKGPEALKALAESVDFRNLIRNQKHVILYSKMPEFSVSFRDDMKKIIGEMGIQEAFTPCADFSGISTAPLMASQMIHQAKIEVDRNGAKASAATALICVGAGLPQEKKTVMIDRPFLFAILHEELELPVFVGIVNQL